MCSLIFDLSAVQIWTGVLDNSIAVACTTTTIVSRGDWLGNPANIEVENNGAVADVASFLTVHNPLFSVHKL